MPDNVGFLFAAFTIVWLPNICANLAYLSSLLVAIASA